MRLTLWCPRTPCNPDCTVNVTVSCSYRYYCNRNVDAINQEILYHPSSIKMKFSDKENDFAPHHGVYAHYNFRLKISIFLISTFHFYFSSIHTIVDSTVQLDLRTISVTV